MGDTPPPETLLIREFGVVVSSADAAHLLGFKSTNALAKARARGILPIPMSRLPHRKGWFAETEAIARWLGRVSMPTAATLKAKRARMGERAS